MVWGAFWAARGQGLDVDRHQLEAQIVIGISAGAVLGLVLHLTKNYRSRGKMQHYFLWTLPCFAAAFVFMIPANTGGWFHIHRSVLPFGSELVVV